VTQHLKLEFFNGFRATGDDGKPLSFSSKKALALLAYLAVESDRAQPREKLAGLLWGNTGDERSRHNLRQAVAKIRQSLGDVLISESDALSIDTATCATDVDAFRTCRDVNDTTGLRQSLDLYQGEFLHGLETREPAYSDWLADTRSRFRQEACDVAARLASQLAADKDQEGAIAALEDLLTVDPAYEPAHRELMRLYAEIGRRSDALRQFGRCCDALQRELGASPDDDTRTLYASLKIDQRPADNSATDIKVEHKSSIVPAVAVLPFDNLSGEEATYFSDGIAEDLITALSSFRALAVISRASSFLYRDRQATDQVIARELGAQYLVRGSVQRSRKRVRISVQLMEADQGLQVWGHRYDRELEDVFALQDEITAILVSTLAGRVEAARLSHARKAPAERLDAYDLVLRGKDHHHRFTAEDCEICIDMFRRAIERDPTYAVAHAWLACAYGQAMVFRPDDIPALVDLSQASAEQGLELDENESECHRVLAQVQLTRRNLDRSLWYQNRALFLNPNDDRILCAQGEILTFTGDAEAGEAWVRKSLRLNPYHPQRYWTHLARALLHLGRFEETLQALDNITRPRIDDRVYRIVASYGHGDSDSAKAEAAELATICPDLEPAKFAADMPYTSPEYREHISGPLQTVFES
jgi:TolB-like protein/Tfp pilus assembly protein PilF